MTFEYKNSLVFSVFLSEISFVGLLTTLIKIPKKDVEYPKMKVISEIVISESFMTTVFKPLKSPGNAEIDIPVLLHSNVKKNLC